MKKTIILSLLLILLVVFIFFQVNGREEEEEISQFCHYFSKDLRYGQKGEEVKMLQKVLDKEKLLFGGEYEMEEEEYFYGTMTAFGLFRFISREDLREEDNYFNLGLLFEGSLREEINRIYGCEKEEIEMDLGEYRVLESSQQNHKSKKIEIIRSEEELGRYLEREEEISFDNKKAVLIALGERRTGGYGIKIEEVKVKEEEKIIELLFRETSPSLGEPVLQVISYPAKIILLRTDDYTLEVREDIETEETTEFINCLKEAGVVIYGTRYCPACSRLIEDYGGYEMVTPIYVDCTEERERCLEEMKHHYVPEIQVRERLYEGIRDPETLGEFVGCK